MSGLNPLRRQVAKKVAVNWNAGMRTLRMIITQFTNPSVCLDTHSLYCSLHSLHPRFVILEPCVKSQLMRRTDFVQKKEKTCQRLRNTFQLTASPRWLQMGFSTVGVNKADSSRIISDILFRIAKISKPLAYIWKGKKNFKTVP